MKLPFKRGDSAATPSSETRPSLFPMHEDVRRMFQGFFGDEAWPFGLSALGGEGAGALSGFRPSVDVADAEDHVEVTAELPGLEAKDIHLELENGALVLRGEKKLEKEEKEKGVWRTERSWGSFQRVIPLPVEVKEDGVDASFQNGVLTVRLPKTSETPKRKIDIRH